MIRVHIWPRGLIGQVMAVLLTAVVLEFLGSALLYDYFDRYSTREEKAQHLAEQLVVADRLLSSARPEVRSKVASQLSSHHIIIGWQRHPLADQTHRSTMLMRMRQEMTRWERQLAGREIRLASADSDPLLVRGTLMLEDRSYLYFSTKVRSRWQVFTESFFSIAILILGVMIAAALVIRALSAPLRAMAKAADAAGHGIPVIMSERGPRDLRVLARAFNAMQQRIANLLASRTRALAAVSHDLRTPLSRLRLRSEVIDDPFARAALSKDIDEMEKMLDSVLTYLAGEAAGEDAQLTDLAALAMTVADEAADAGMDVRYDGPDSLPATVSRLRVKRALANLVENGVKYADAAVVRLHVDEEGVHLIVEDEGPGIPAEQLGTAIEPFQRLDAERPRNTDGLGLGLSIVSHTMEQEGGALLLSNREPHGLRAEMLFPHVRNGTLHNLK